LSRAWLDPYSESENSARKAHGEERGELDGLFGEQTKITPGKIGGGTIRSGRQAEKGHKKIGNS